MFSSGEVWPEGNQNSERTESWQIYRRMLKACLIYSRAALLKPVALTQQTMLHRCWEWHIHLFGLSSKWLIGRRGNKHLDRKQREGKEEDTNGNINSTGGSSERKLGCQKIITHIMEGLLTQHAVLRALTNSLRRNMRWANAGKRRNRRTGDAAAGLVSTRAEGATRCSSNGPRRRLSASISPLHNSRKLIRGSEWLIEQSGKAIGKTPQACRRHTGRALCCAATAERTESLRLKLIWEQVLSLCSELKKAVVF